MATKEQLAKIQALIDKGASEEDIQTVVDYFKKQGQPLVESNSVLDKAVNIPGVGPVTARGFFQGATEGLKGRRIDGSGTGLLGAPINIPGVGPITVGGMLEGESGGARGFAPGLVHGVKTAIPNVGRGLMDAAAAGVEGIKAFKDDPTGSVARALTGAYQSGSKVPEMVEKLKAFAASDPEGFGRAVGDLTGNAEAMMGLSQFVPLLPRPIALRVGQALEKTGKAGDFAAYLTGAHQIASGKPEGIVTMAVPSAMRASAKPLIRFGMKGAKGVPVHEQISIQPEVPDVPLHAVQDTLPQTPAPAPSRTPIAPIRETPRFNDRPLHEQMDMLPAGAEAAPAPVRGRGPEPPFRPQPQSTGVPVDQPVGAAQYLADLKKMSKADQMAELARRQEATATRSAVGAETPDLPTSGPMEEALAGGPATPAEAPYSFYDSLPAPETMSMEDILKGPGTMTPEPNRAPGGRGPDPRIEQGIGPDRGPTREQFGAADTARKAGFDDIQSQMLRAIMEQEGAGEYPGMTAEGSGQLDPITGASVGPAVGEMPPKQLAGEVDNGLPAGAEVSGEAAYDPSNPPPGPSIGSASKPRIRITTDEPSPLTSEDVDAVRANLPPNPDLEIESLADALEQRPRGPKQVREDETFLGDLENGVDAGLSVSEMLPPSEGVERPSPTLKPRVRVSPIGSLVEPSRSRRGKSSMSATPGYTNADITAAGLDPAVAHTHLTPEQAQRMIAARKARQDKYYAAALSDKAAREAGLSDAGAP